MPKIKTKNAKLILHADDTGIAVTNPSSKDFKINTNKIIVDKSEWFKTNLLSFNFKEIHYLQFRTKIFNKLV